MNLEALGAVVVLAIAALIGLAFTLRHLAAMRVTSGETAVLGGRIDALKAELVAFNSTLTILNNRQR